MRALVLLLVGIVSGCAPARTAQKEEKRPEPTSGETAPPPASPRTPATPECAVKTRTISVPGRGGVRPHIAGAAGAFAVVWEESERHPGIHFLALDADANPIGAPVEVADLERPGAEPRLIASGDGFVVIWTVDAPDTSIIAMRRIDARGRPLSDVMPTVATRNARPLAAAATDDGIALAWWTFGTDPPVQSLTWLDRTLKPRGKPITMVRGLLSEPSAGLRAAAGTLRGAWVEVVDGADHVVTAELTRTGVTRKTDLGPGDDPSFAGDTVVFTTLADGAVFRARFGETPPTRIAEGQAPTADAGALCLASYGSGEGSPGDVLRCRELRADGPGPEHRILTAPGGVLTLGVARSGDTTGVVYQTLEEGGAMAVDFVAVRCATP
jgi:hypothetical protein